LVWVQLSANEQHITLKSMKCAIMCHCCLIDHNNNNNSLMIPQHNQTKKLMQFNNIIMPYTIANWR